MTSPPICPQCGAPVQAGVLGGLCPACVRRVAFAPADTDTNADAETIHTDGPRAAASGAALTSFGDYDLIEQIARGGMGVVYRARQRSLGREVALKMVLSGQFAGAEEVRRFRAEAEAAARLDHPHIVPIYEVGEHEGRAWFAMRLIEGGTLARRVKDAPGGKLAPREAAALLVKIARAVHYAHQRGLIHRDLKPANILLDAQGEPHVTDFGLAKEIESNGNTLTGAVLGTPGYMAPEQAAGRVSELTTAVDVFALGAIFYHLLAGRPPFEGGSSLEVITNIIKCEPARPTTLGARIDRDLETIVLRCLEKEPAARFGSAEAFADDLDRWLRGETILARRSTMIERTVKWARRRPAIAALGTAAALFFIMGVAGVFWQWRRAEAALADSRASLWTASFERARSVRATRRMGQRTEALAAIRQAAAIRVTPELRDEAIAALALFDVEDTGQKLDLPAKASQVAVDARYKLAAWLVDSRALVVADLATGKVLLEVPDSGLGDAELHISSQAEAVVARGKNETTRVWGLSSPEHALQLGKGAGEPGIVSASVSPDGALMLCSDRAGRLRSVDLRTMTAATVREGLQGPWITRAHPHEPLAAVDCKDGIHLIRLTDGTTERRLARLSHGVGGMAWSADGSLFAVGYLEPLIEVHDLKSGGRRQFRGHTGAVITACFHPSLPLLATCSWDNTTRLWDALTGQEILQFNGQRLLGFSPDGARLAVWSQEAVRSLVVHHPVSGRLLGLEAGGTMIPDRLDFSPDGALLAGMASARGVCLWDVASGARRALLRAPAGGIAFENHTTLLTTGRGGLQRWSFTMAADPAHPLEIALAETIPVNSDLLAGHLALVPGAREALAQPIGQPPRLISLDDGRVLRAYADHAHTAAFACSADGRWVAAGFWNSNVNQQALTTVWEKDSGKQAARIPGTKSTVSFSPDSRVLVVGSLRDYRLFETGSWRELARHEVRESDVAECESAFSPDGALLALYGTDRVIRLLDARTGAERARLISPDQGILKSLRFSPDSRHLAAGTSLGVQLWNLAAIRAQLAELGIEF